LDKYGFQKWIISALRQPCDYKILGAEEQKIIMQSLYEEMIEM
jgi:hypothetical protein